MAWIVGQAAEIALWGTGNSKLECYCQENVIRLQPSSQKCQAMQIKVLKILIKIWESHTCRWNKGLVDYWRIAYADKFA